MCCVSWILLDLLVMVVFWVVYGIDGLLFCVMVTFCWCDNITCWFVVVILAFSCDVFGLVLLLL